jgi:hypothetical protein
VLLAPPRGRRQAVFAPECADERRIGPISDIFGYSRQWCIAAAKKGCSKHHSPLRQIFHRSASNEMLKALSEHRPRSSRRASQRIQRPWMRRTRMHLTQCSTDNAVANRNEPSGSLRTLLVHVQAQDLNEEQLGQFCQHTGAAWAR